MSCDGIIFHFWKGKWRQITKYLLWRVRFCYYFYLLSPFLLWILWLLSTSCLNSSNILFTKSICCFRILWMNSSLLFFWKIRIRGIVTFPSCYLIDSIDLCWFLFRGWSTLRLNRKWCLFLILLTIFWRRSFLFWVGSLLLGLINYIKISLFFKSSRLGIFVQFDLFIRGLINLFLWRTVGKKVLSLKFFLDCPVQNFGLFFMFQLIKNLYFVDLLLFIKFWFHISFLVYLWLLISYFLWDNNWLIAD